MIRAVFDTNVLVSALLSPESPPARLLELALQGKMRLIFSPQLLEEARRVFSYPKLQRTLKKRGIDRGELEEVIGKILKVAVLTQGKRLVEAIPEDPADDMVLACAMEGQADFIISGDHHLIDLEAFAGIKIVDPTTFLKAFLEEGE